jgi:hypothetical protein
MPRESFPALDRVCVQCGEPWVQRDGQPPRAYCTTSCRNEAERQARAVRGELRAEPPPPVRTFTRQVRAQQHTITCAWCEQVVTLEQYPGPAPRYCSPLCKTAAAREGAAERMRRMRARRQQVSQGVTQSEMS